MAEAVATTATNTAAAATTATNTAAAAATTTTETAAGSPAAIDSDSLTDAEGDSDGEHLERRSLYRLVVSNVKPLLEERSARIRALKDEVTTGIRNYTQSKGLFWDLDVTRSLCREASRFCVNVDEVVQLSGERSVPTGRYVLTVRHSGASRTFFGEVPHFGRQRWVAGVDGEDDAHGRRPFPLNLAGEVTVSLYPAPHFDKNDTDTHGIVNSCGSSSDTIAYYDLQASRSLFRQPVRVLFNDPVCFMCGKLAVIMRVSWTLRAGSLHEETE